jgi:phage N-6-adenine-methyltransferase
VSSEPFAACDAANGSDGGQLGPASRCHAGLPTVAASEPCVLRAKTNGSDGRACLRCGAPLAGRRVDAVTCSAACRAAWRRQGATPRADRLAARWGLLPRDFWRTPPTLVMAVAAELGGAFGLDAASAGDDAVAPRWLTPDDDALVSSWAVACHPEHRRAWCNPPYSKVAGGAGGAGLLAWVEAGVRARDEGLVVAMLVPPSTSTRYWRLAFEQAAEILLCSKRVSFLDPNTGEPDRGNRGDSAILIFRPGQRGPALVRPWWPMGGA